MTEDVFNKKGQNNPKHPLYRVWASMKNRCLNRKDAHNYSWYGGRGVRICDRWLGEHGFANFVKDMGERPKGYSIDRIDVNGDYCPENCKWSSAEEQSRNRRNNVKVVVEGDTLTPLDISKKVGISEETIRARIRKGKNGSELLSPLGKGAPRRVICIETGEEFCSLAAAARAKGLHSNSLWSVLRGPSKTAGGLHWRYADEVYEQIKRLV